MAEAKLDSMFSEHCYWHGNEPCHQVAYLYNDLGAPEKTRKQVRHILDTEYLNVPGGLSGNDDAGQMSAWYVFSAMGFYPVAPSTPYYYVSAPIFDKITITPAGGKSVVITSDASADDPQEIPTRISHSDLTSGGILKF